MMNRKEFYEYVKDNVKDYLPDSYQNGEIRIEEVAKNNGLRLTGISIPQGDQRAVPMVYLDSLYMEYVNGKIWIPVWVMWQICVLKCRTKRHLSIWVFRIFWIMKNEGQITGENL